MKKTKTEDLFKVAEIKLVYKRGRDTQNTLKISNEKMAYEILKTIWDMNKIDLQEEFKIILVSTDNTCLGVSHLSTGGISACILDPRLVFVTALKANATKIILAHNHPSGNLKASPADIRITKKMCSIGNQLDIEVMDHLIVTSQGYLSMACEGLMP